MDGSIARQACAACWHGFFVNAFDPARFVSLDKPPLALLAMLVLPLAWALSTVLVRPNVAAPQRISPVRAELP